MLGDIVLVLGVIHCFQVHIAESHENGSPEERSCSLEIMLAPIVVRFNVLEKRPAPMEYEQQRV